MYNENENEITYGRNAVFQALQSDITVNALYLQSGALSGGIGKVLALAKEKRIVIKTVSAEKLSDICQSTAHQGVALSASPVKYAELNDILEKENPFVVVLDGIEDPHNLGAIIRTAACAGADGVVIPKHRSVSVTGTVAKASAGAVSNIKIARVANIADTIDRLKARNIWCYCADMNGTAYDKFDFKGGVCLVLGSEGNGVSRLVKDKCDAVISIPMFGGVSSLNVSVAGGILMFACAKARNS
jgi:rRNA methylase, putative, group 3